MWSVARQACEYLGAAHGIAGILHVLLLCPRQTVQPHMPTILKTIEWLIECQDSTGNWPTTAPLPGNHNNDKGLVQWCHGATGILILLSTLLRYTSPNSPPLLHKVIAAIQTGAELVYRHGLLRKGLGLCHGVSGERVRAVGGIRRP
ncbi:Lanthionine synthetase c family protein [Mycena kentingensis (nom. inval.)]|nr:Lanthionine synthetase c family protein [Mycena kentingensis (nom. inval.)]